MLTLYTKDNCGFCMSAKALLINRKIEFNEVNIEQDQDARKFIIEQGHRTMPQIYQGDDLYVEGGFQGLREKLEQEDVDVSDLGDL